MELDFGSLDKPVRALRRSLKSLTRDPSMEEVHNLRTGSRRVEAIAAALMPGDKKLRRRLMKAIRPVRKAAGEVRDMDVLAANARTLARHRRNNSVARLLEYLRSKRVEGARKLLDTVAEQRNNACRCLKRFSRQIEKRFHGNKPRTAASAAGGVTIGEAAMRLIDELNGWPAFTAENLHPFRIKVKKLRCLLQLDKDTNLRFVNALAEVKEQIGEWHDWQLMKKIAEEVLDPEDHCATLKKIDKIGRKKLNHALAGAQTMKTKSLSRLATTGKAKNSRAI
jgi:CHAD domain-containing protein